MIGLFLGEKDLPNEILKKIETKKINYFIIDLTKKNKFKKKKNSYFINIGKFGEILKLIKLKKCKKVIFAGNIIKPKISKLKLDLKGLFYIPRIVKAAKLGDAAILKALIKILSENNIKVIKLNTYNPELTLKKGNYTKVKPSKQENEEILKGEKNSIIIGNNNKLREYVNINPGTKQGGGVTKIGDNNLFMVYCHVAHDCLISNNIVLANNVQVGGHVSIQDNAIVGGSCAIHQFSRIGESAMIGGMTGVLSDVIPFGLSMGNRNNLMGLNLIGLRRSKVSNENIKKIQLAYKNIFKTASFRDNIENLNTDLKSNKFIKKIINFINSDKRFLQCRY